MAFGNNQAPQDLFASRSDTVEQFIEECCLIGPYRAELSVLYNDCMHWCGVNNKSAELSSSIFGNTLLMQGFQYANDGQFHGLGLLDLDIRVEDIEVEHDEYVENYSQLFDEA